MLVDDPVMAVGNIEVWLQNLVDGMQNTIKSVIRMAHDEVHEQDLETYIFTQHPRRFRSWASSSSGRRTCSTPSRRQRRTRAS